MLVNKYKLLKIKASLFTQIVLRLMLDLDPALWWFLGLGPNMAVNAHILQRPCDYSVFKNDKLLSRNVSPAHKRATNWTENIFYLPFDLFCLKILGATGTSFGQLVNSLSSFFTLTLYNQTV